MPRVKQFDQTEVLEKAKELFWKQGYHATSIQNLVDHLGINRASIYDTFGGKNELYEAAFKSYRDENSTFLKKHFSSFKSVRDAIKTLLYNAAEMSLEDPDRKGCFIVNCTTEYLPTHQDFLSEVLQNKANFNTIVSQALERGKQNGEFSSDLNSDETASFIFTFLSGLKVTSKVEQSSSALKRMIGVALKVLH